MIIVASDLHGRVSAAKRLEELFLSLQPEKIVILGDFLYNGPRNGVPSDYDGMKVAEILRPYESKILGVRGNCDADIDLDVLGLELPKRRTFECLGHRFILVHGDHMDPAFVDAKQGDIVLFGHSHLLLVEERDGVAYVNPGSTSFPKGGNPASFATIDEKGIRILKFDDSSVLKSLDF